MEYTIMDSGNINPIRILVAEDNPINQRIISQLAKNESRYTIEIAKNGAEAIEKVKSATYDIIFMDNQMPVKGGLDATREIREFNKTTPIVVQSDDPDIKTTFANLEVDFLEGNQGKLGKKEQLINTITKLGLF